MNIVQLFETCKFPDESYNGLRLRVRLNPAGQIWDDFNAGGFHATPEEQARIELRRSLIAGNGISDEDRETYIRLNEELETAIAARCEKMGRALVALFGTSEPQEVETEYGPVTLDFTTPEAALKTAEDSRLPDELTWWLTQVPGQVIERRRTFIREQLPKSFVGRS
jgi:hypothetical protein